MKTLILWILICVILAMGVGWYLTGMKRRTLTELKNVGELELEQNVSDSATLRGLLVATPSEKQKDELMKQVAALRESANVLRDDYQATYGSVTPAQEHQIDHLRRHAAELENIAGHLDDKSLTDAARLELYRQAVMTYGAGGYVARQMRKEVGLPDRGK